MPQNRQIEGLPPGAIVRPIRPRDQRIEGLPPGAIVRPIQRAQDGGNQGAEEQSTQPETFADRHPFVAQAGDLLQAVLSTPEELSTGAAKGIGSTGYNLAKLTNKGMRAVLPQEFADKYVPPFPEQTPDVLRPHGFMQKAGFLGEQAAEFVVPSGAVAKGARATEAGLDALKLAPRVVKGGRLLAEMGLEGVATGAVTGAQGGDVKTGALLGAAAPVASRAMGPVVKAVEEKIAPGIGNKLLRPRDSQFSFGKNPGRAASKVGITKDMPSLVGKLQELKASTGRQIDALLSQPQYASKAIDVKPLIEKPIDEAIQDALAKPIGAGKQELIDNLMEMKNDFLYTRALDPQGKLMNGTPRNLMLNPLDATVLKRQIGDSTRWTGSAFDKDINQARVAVYQKIKQAVERVAPDVKVLNRDYGDALEAQAAATKRMHAGDRNSPLSLTDLIVGSTTGLGEVVSSGSPAGAAFGIGAAVANKGARSTAGRTIEIAAAKGLAKTPGRLLRNIGLASGNRILDDAGQSGQ